MIAKAFDLLFTNQESKRIPRGEVHEILAAALKIPINHITMPNIKAVLKDKGVRETTGRGKKYYSNITKKG